MKKATKRTMMLMTIGILSIHLSACDRKQSAGNGKGVAERAGQQLDQAAAEAGKELNKAAEKTGEGLQQLGAKLQKDAQEARKKD